jgi:putative phosphoesterase
MTRILLLADIHANWPALQAINERFDLCICLGDLVDYGLEPAPCIDWVRSRCQLLVRGNHDHGAAQNVVVNGQSGFKWLTSVTRPLTRQLLSEPNRRFLMEMPITRWATIDDLRFLMVHATPRDPLDEYAPATVEFWTRQLENVDADIVCVGHTHIPSVLEVAGKIVVNPGSVGLPRDGNPRASYAIIENRKVELKRIDYPIDQTIEVIRGSGLPEAAKELLIEVYRTGEAKNPKVDTRIQRARPSGQGIARPGAVPAVQQAVRPRPTAAGVTRPAGTAPGVDPSLAGEVSGLAGDGSTPADPRRDSRPVPAVGKNISPPAEPRRVSPDDIDAAR